MAAKRPTDFYKVWQWYKEPQNPSIKGIPVAQNLEQLSEIESTKQFLEKIDRVSFKGSIAAIPMKEEMSSNVFKLLKILEETKKIDRFAYTYFLTQFTTGARIGDLAKATREDRPKLKIKGVRIYDIDFGNGIIELETTKKNRPRIVKMIPTLAEELKLHIDTYGLKDDDYLFFDKINGEEWEKSHKKNTNHKANRTINSKGSNNTFLSKTLRQAYFNAFNEQAPKGFGTHEFRRGWFTLLAGIRDARFLAINELGVSQLGGHMDPDERKAYVQAITRTGEGITDVNFGKSPLLKEILIETDHMMKQMAAISTGYSNWNLHRPTTSSGRKRYAKKTDPSYVTLKAQNFNELEGAVRKILGGSSSFIGTDADIEEAGRLFPDMPRTDVDKKLAQAAAKGWAQYGFAKQAVDKKRIKIAEEFINLETNRLVKFNNKLTPNIMSGIVEDLFESKFNPAFFDIASEKIDELVRIGIGFEYPATHLLDPLLSDKPIAPKIPKGSIVGGKLPIQGAGMYFDDAGLADLVTVGNRLDHARKPMIKLNPNVLRSILYKILDESFAQQMSHKLMASTQHFDLGVDDYNTRAEVRQRVIWNALDKYEEKFSNLSSRNIVHNIEQDNSLSRVIAQIKNSTSNALMRAEYSYLTADELKRIVDNYPDVFPKDTSKILDHYKKYKSPINQEFIYRARLEPYLKYLSEQGVLPEHTFTAGVKEDYRELWRHPLRAQVNLLAPADFTSRRFTNRAQIPWVYDLRTRLFDTEFGTMGFATPERTSSAHILPSFDWQKLNLTIGKDAIDVETKQPVKETNVKKAVEKLNKYGGTINKTKWGVLAALPAAEVAIKSLFNMGLLANPVVGGAVKTAGVIGLNVGIETASQFAFADFAGQGQGFYNDNLDNPIILSDGSAVFPNVSYDNMQQQYDQLTDASKAELQLFDWDSLGLGDLEQVDTGIVRKHVEELKDLGRNLGIAGSAVETVSPAGYNPGVSAARIKTTDIPDPATRMQETIEESDEQERTDPELKRFRAAVTKENLDKIANKDRERVERFERQFGNTFSDDVDETGLRYDSPPEYWREAGAPNPRGYRPDEYVAARDRLRNVEKEKQNIIDERYGIDKIKDTEVDLVPDFLKNEETERLSTEEQVGNLFNQQPQGENNAVNG